MQWCAARGLQGWLVVIPRLQHVLTPAMLCNVPGTCAVPLIPCVVPCVVSLIPLKGVGDVPTSAAAAYPLPLPLWPALTSEDHSVVAPNFAPESLRFQRQRLCFFLFFIRLENVHPTDRNRSQPSGLGQNRSLCNANEFSDTAWKRPLSKKKPSSLLNRLEFFGTIDKKRSQTTNFGQNRSGFDEKRFIETASKPAQKSHRLATVRLNSPLCQTPLVPRTLPGPPCI
mmetsp:Transcript_120498/g.209759  ORF Transcript_120498/g.209759 Transcript_120498/m.209759 type:complete len:227 (+) Transcript_120498:652-1332(+)